MARRSPRIPELRQKNEVKSMWGLYSILESCQGCHHSHKMISNGRPVNKHIIGNVKKIDQLPRPSFDEECRRIQSEAELASATVDARERNFTQEDVPITKQNIVKGQQHTKMDPQLINRLVKAHKRSKKNSQRSHHRNADGLVQHLPSTSAEISLNKLTLTAILGAILAQNHQEEGSAKGFIDQMFIDRKKFEGTETESKSFSDALELVNSNKALFVDLLPDPNSQLARRIKNLRTSQTAKETIKTVLDSSSSEQQKGKTNKNFWKKIDKCEDSRRRSFTSDKIVILQPVRENARHSDIACNCSSMQSHRKVSHRVSDAKVTSFSFREMKKKLKHTFTRKGPNKLPKFGNSVELSQEEGEGKLWKKQDIWSIRGSDIASPTGTVRKKLDFSSVGFSNKQKFDVTLEAKRQLSARLKNVNAVETVTYKKSPKTLERVLSSPEHDFLPLSPRFGSYISSFSRSTENSFRIVNGREMACLSPLRPNSEVTLCDDHNKYDSALPRMDQKENSLIPPTDEEVHEVSAADDVKSIGESDIVEINGILRCGLHISEAQSEINSSDITRAMQITGTIELQNNDETAGNSIPRSPSAKEASTSTMDDFPSSPMSICQLDEVDCTKYQEEHQSPVSVLDPFFTEDASSPPPSIKLQTDGQQLKPLRLDFEECSSNQDLSSSPNSCMQEQDHLSQYVHWLLQASCLDWDHLSETLSPPEEDMLHYSLFDEMEFIPLDSYFDPKMLFDHINEILLELQQRHFRSSHWLDFVKPKIMPHALAEVVLDQIMTEADFYLLPQTEKRTLNQLVSKDVSGCRSWLDVRFDTEQMVVEISDDVLEESILDILIELLT